MSTIHIYATIYSIDTTPAGGRYIYFDGDKSYSVPFLPSFERPAQFSWRPCGKNSEAIKLWALLGFFKVAGIQKWLNEDYGCFFPTVGYAVIALSEYEIPQLSNLQRWEISWILGRIETLRSFRLKDYGQSGSLQDLKPWIHDWLSSLN